ncbi:sodium:proton antiporter NhaD [Aquirufa antheringensis]|uniref:Sodium:proton antiporter n=1 Tax=Aquirufa antheringensis TaxID=2516559 RepID=A0A4Q9BDN7_9BACT|nr:sodium:proton antiporter NhaD [Aquirufa antheringensis]MCZ2484516.1 sodium:proton antiporter [Aquirufa antheringensis]TBH74279.1 sodium:proton antiporter [Aquirufa antheringensis]
MGIASIIVFILGYLAITLEHPLKINKTATALVTGVLVWTLYAISTGDASELGHHLASTSEILFFLLGAMTLVELVDAHQGFYFVSRLIKTDKVIKLLWIVGLITFFMSAVLDNLTSSIVMVTLLRKLISNKETRKYFVGIVVIAANAGGAWSPIGDVTTTMLWIGGQISATGIIQSLLLPSLVALLVPLIIASYVLKNQAIGQAAASVALSSTEERDGKIMLFAGAGSLIGVPIFKTLTHLPPYMGILLALGIVWILSELLHSEKDEEAKKHLSVGYALTKIDTSSILFFLGILLAIGGLESFGYLHALSDQLAHALGNQNLIVTIIGLASAVVDNVPLVAATMGMYSLTDFPMDHVMWEYLAFCAGTGGSILIIGSAAGVAVMGMEKIEFGWYLKKIGFLALLGYFAGAGLYLLLH